MHACKGCQSCTFSTHGFSHLLEGYQTLCKRGMCRVLPKCGQFVPVLMQVRASGTYECPVFQHGFLKNAASHGYNGFIRLMLTSTATQQLMIHGHVMASFGESDRQRFFQWVAIVNFGYGHMVGCGFHTINIDTRSKGKCTIVYP